ncbi:MAG: glucokinase [Candidatus Binataceae bacterium]
MARVQAMADVIVAGDIGGTKTHLALYHLEGAERRLIRDQIYQTQHYRSLQEVLHEFLGATSGITAACFGVPGAVIDGVSQATNIAWKMREGELAAALGGARIRLINDLQATAYGMLRLSDDEVAVLQKGVARAEPRNIVVVAAGTGLGEAALIATPQGYHAIASEGGHCDFAPRGPEQEQLLEFLTRDYDHVSFERVLSGPGLHNIYRFLRAQAQSAEPPWLTERIRREDPSAVISEVALSNGDPHCVRALELFAAIYGAEASNMALKLLALGGVYLGGGIAPKILPFLQRGAFIAGFLNKGRFKELLATIEVRVSLNEAAALDGAAYMAGLII